MPKKLKGRRSSTPRFDTSLRFSGIASFAGRIILNDKDVEVFNFGKYKGQPVEEVLKKDPGYFGWILNGDFPLYTKNVLTNIKLRAFGK